MRFTSNRASEVGKVRRVFRTAAQVLGREFTQAITDPIWDWPFGESPRDIVDLGQLRASQRTDFKGDFAAQFSWGTDYALPVFLGAVRSNGTVLPPRNAPKLGLERFGQKDVVNRLLAKEFS